MLFDGKVCSTVTIEATALASGNGWSVQEVICSAGPRDRAFEERHETVSVAAVLAGTFLYRSGQGDALLAPGSLLLGNHGQCFECGHEHGTGDHCLSFHFTPACWENLVAAMPGVRKATFGHSHVPPVASLTRLLARLESARQENAAALEEIAIDLAGIALHVDAELCPRSGRLGRHDVQRVSDAVRRIEADAQLADDSLTLGELSREAGLSPWHFLRVFRRVVGMTPHQYVLRTRMHRAAVQLRDSTTSISGIAFEAGFSDLSTFNHRFRTVMGMNPGAYRARPKC
ncbi:AraC family transcriptional regulator [Rhodanobacter sp. Root561]|uniref:helix-turn-helix transcriptional regulator n=1 Tax=Rhodanobacter sp. Root561 TaxID=1736560 RepID=UPI00190FCC6E|nr:AraC family transcriptional regulator [Rhodanobacter sp. Root561]